MTAEIPAVYDLDKKFKLQLTLEDNFPYDKSFAKLPSV